MKYKLTQNQCGFVLKDGCFMKTIYQGTWNYSNFLGWKVVYEEMDGTVEASKTIPKELLLQDPEFAKRTLEVRIPEGFLGILRENGAVKEILTDPEYLFWNPWGRYTVELLDMRQPEMDVSSILGFLHRIPAGCYKRIDIQPGELGILYHNWRMVGELQPGTYYYWTWSGDVTCRIVDLKSRNLEINGQEILTADRIGIRLNVICTYHINNPRQMIETIKNLENHLYTCVQLILREYIGRYRLDELLEQKSEISGYIFRRLKEEQDAYCVEFSTAGIKDIILPGEIRDIMNTVLIAERKAQANVITRREEVASTRSLLNTARLMDENKTLYKLKELEALERICTQVGSIHVAGGGALLEQLRELMG